MQFRGHGDMGLGIGGLSPLKQKLQGPQIEISNTINEWDFCRMNIKPTAQTQTPPTDDFLATFLFLRYIYVKLQQNIVIEPFQITTAEMFSKM